ncbi:MAG: helix-turn-helix domain-containing protein [Promethearchaeota archaeon]
MRIIRDPKTVQVVVEKSRYEIWKLLKEEGQLTADVIAEKVDKNVSTIYRHLKKLVDVGFVNEHEVQKGNQKYVVKEYTAEMQDAFFVLSKEAEKLIASHPGEISYLKEKTPLILENFKLIGLDPGLEMKKAADSIGTLSIRLSEFIGDLLEEENQDPKKIPYTQEFEIMRRYVATFLTQIDPEFNHQVETLRKLLMKK